MITVHHLNNSRSQRILWMLEELGIEYEVKHYQRDKDNWHHLNYLRYIHWVNPQLLPMMHQKPQ